MPSSPSATAFAPPRGTLFRQWATARLTELLVKGFTLDDERIKAGRTHRGRLLRRTAGPHPRHPRQRTAVLSEDHGHLRHQHRLRPSGRADAAVLPDRAEQDALGGARPHRGRDRSPARRRRSAEHGLDHVEERSRRAGSQAGCGHRQELPVASGNRGAQSHRVGVSRFRRSSRPGRIGRCTWPTGSPSSMTSFG